MDGFIGQTYNNVERHIDGALLLCLRRNQWHTYLSNGGAPSNSHVSSVGFKPPGLPSNGNASQPLQAQSFSANASAPTGPNRLAGIPDKRTWVQSPCEAALLSAGSIKITTCDGWQVAMGDVRCIWATHGSRPSE